MSLIALPADASTPGLPSALHLIANGVLDTGIFDIAAETSSRWINNGGIVSSSYAKGSWVGRMGDRIGFPAVTVVTTYRSRRIAGSRDSVGRCERTRRQQERLDDTHGVLVRANEP